VSTTAPRPRTQLQTLLEGLLGSNKVYFQPPANLQIQYPCIVYNRDDAITQYANNKPYDLNKRYQLTAIDRNPDSPVPDKIAALPLCTFDRHFAADNLNHDVFTIYF